MVKASRWLAALTIAALVTGTALAQPPEGGGGRRGGRGPGGPGGGMMRPGGLLLSEDVQKELGLTDDQVKKVKEAVQKVRDKHQEEFSSLQGMDEETRTKRMELARTANKEIMESLGDVLKPEQAKRLKQIMLQARLQMPGGMVFNDPEVQSELKLTDDQKEKIKTISEDAQKEMREAFTGGGRDEMRKKMASLRKETMDKIKAVLTDDQKKTWEEMTGKPFEFRLGGPGRGRRGNGGGGGGDR